MDPDEYIKDLEAKLQDLEDLFEKSYRVRERFAKKVEKLIAAFHTSTQILAVKDLTYIAKEEDLESIFAELQSRGYVRFTAIGPRERDRGGYEPESRYEITEPGRKYAREILEKEED